MEPPNYFSVLPKLLLNEIFKRLPATAIPRCRRVCRRWRKRLKKPFFIAEHRRFSAPENDLLLIHAYNSDHENPSLRSFNPKNETVEALNTRPIDSMGFGWTIIGSCNGLVCVELKNHARDLFLWNPATEDVREIPPTTNSDVKRLCMVGFGFSRVSNDYKILRIYTFTRHYRAEVFSSRADAWHDIVFESFVDTALQYNGLQFDETILWEAWRYDNSSAVLILFHMSTGTFSLKTTPTTEDGISPFGGVSGFKVYQKKLVGHYVGDEGPPTEDGEKTYFTNLWVMEDAEWNRLSCTERSSFGPTPFVEVPACFWKNEAVFCLHYDSEDDLVVLYHMVNLITGIQRTFNCPIDFACECCDTFNYEMTIEPVRHIPA